MYHICCWHLYSIVLLFISNTGPVNSTHILKADESESTNSLIKLRQWLTSISTFAAELVGRHQSLLALNSVRLCTECQTPLFNKTLISLWSLLASTPTEKHTHAHTPTVSACQTEIQDPLLSWFDSCCKLSFRMTDWNGDKYANSTNGERLKVKKKERGRRTKTK